MTDKTVMLYAFAIHPNGDEGHVDPNDPSGPTPDGWCVYLRTETPDEREPFKITGEVNFATWDEAHKYGKRLAEKLGCDLEEY